MKPNKIENTKSTEYKDAGNSGKLRPTKILEWPEGYFAEVSRGFIDTDVISRACAAMISDSEKLQVETTDYAQTSMNRNKELFVKVSNELVGHFGIQFKRNLEMIYAQMDVYHDMFGHLIDLKRK